MRILPVLLIVVGAGGCSERLNLWHAESITPGMTFDQVWNIMGEPDVGWGIPGEDPNATSDLYYRIPNDQYAVIHFVGDRVAKPAMTKESRLELIE